MTHPANRRIDRVLAFGFLDDIAERPMPELRAMRADAEQEETDLSYLRRLLQGRLDLINAEQARRSKGTGGSLLDALPGILADSGGSPAPRGLGRHISAEPSRLDSHRRVVESLAADTRLSDPTVLDDETLVRLRDRLMQEESGASDLRRQVQQVMDACSDEIGRRYRDGDVTIDTLLPQQGS